MQQSVVSKICQHMTERVDNFVLDLAVSDPALLLPRYVVRNICMIYQWSGIDEICVFCTQQILQANNYDKLQLSIVYLLGRLFPFSLPLVYGVHGAVHIISLLHVCLRCKNRAIRKSEAG